MVSLLLPREATGAPRHGARSRQGTGSGEGEEGTPQLALAALLPSPELPWAHPVTSLVGSVPSCGPSSAGPQLPALSKQLCLHSVMQSQTGNPAQLGVSVSALPAPKPVTL